MGGRSALILVFFSLAFVPALSGCAGEELPFGLTSELVARADRASPLAFATDGRLFFGEQYTGTIRVVQANGELQAEPFAQLEVATAAAPDWGLTGLAVDPDFERNHFVYAFYTEPTADAQIGAPAIVRFTERNGRGEDVTAISIDFPETDPEHAGFNANGRAGFGSDGFLYLSVGDYDIFSGAPQRIRGLAEPLGKLLRIDVASGTAAEGNPFLSDPSADQRTFAYGFREPFSFTFHPETGAIYGTDNTPINCEELNIIEAGGDYSWPVGEFPFADCSAGGQKPGVYYFARTNMKPADFLSFVEVSGLAFVQGTVYESMGDSLLVCETIRADAASNGELRRVGLSGPELDQVSSDDLITKGCKGDLAVSPDGIIYYTTDTEIRRLVPGQEDVVPPPPRS